MPRRAAPCIAYVRMRYADAWAIGGLARLFEFFCVMTSAEPARTMAYSTDIGWRIVWQRIGMGLSFRDIADRLQISVSTAHRLYMRFEQTGEVAPLKPQIRPGSRKLDEYHELYIRHSC